MREYMSSQIRGDFEGWDGDVVYELDNGSRWKLTNYTYSYSYKYRPRATIWDDGSGYYLEVDGMSDMKQVRRV